jgi:hypothetical protein
MLAGRGPATNKFRITSPGITYRGLSERVFICFLERDGWCTRHEDGVGHGTETRHNR